MEKISQSITDFICRNLNIYDENMAEIYKYGIEITLSSLINLLIIIICSLLMGDPAAGILFMLVFIFLRSYTGGYHAEAYWRCNVTFAVTYILTFAAAKLLEYLNVSSYAEIFIFILAFIPVLKFAPVRNRHKKLTEEKIKQSRKIAFAVYAFFSALSVFLCSIDIRYGYMLLTTVLSVSVLIIVEVFMQHRGYHASD